MPSGYWSGRIEGTSPTGRYSSRGDPAGCPSASISRPPNPLSHWGGNGNGATACSRCRSRNGPFRSNSGRPSSRRFGLPSGPSSSPLSQLMSELQQTPLDGCSRILLKFCNKLYAQGPSEPQGSPLPTPGTQPGGPCRIVFLWKGGSHVRSTGL